METKQKIISAAVILLGIWPFSRAQKAVSITTASLPPAIVGQSYSAVLQGTGGRKPYRWSIPTGSPWLAISSSGVLTGTPQMCSKRGAMVTFRLIDANGRIADKTLNLEINAAEPLRIVTEILPDGQVGVPYSVQIQAAGGCVAVYP